MPFSTDALEQIRVQLDTISKGIKPRLITVGRLSADQLLTINTHRETNGFPPIVAEILFDGRHLYKSRCVDDAYTIDDVIDQLTSAFSDASKVVLGRSTVLANPNPRTDRYGKTVRDEIVFECTARHPHPELYSVVPRGDGKNHLKTKKAIR
jgi:hypothetical protein